MLDATNFEIKQKNLKIFSNLGEQIFDHVFSSHFQNRYYRAAARLFLRSQNNCGIFSLNKDLFVSIEN
jgi:hypothetical protein